MYRFVLVVAALLALAGCLPAGSLPLPDSRATDALIDSLPEVGLLRQSPAITTSFEDTDPTATIEFEPESFTSLATMPRDDGGAYLLTPGTYQLEVESYCLKAGTRGPSQGDGYLYAPLKGSKSSIVYNLLTRAEAHPEVPQRDIQVLLWAIIARAKFSDMPLTMQATAARMLTPEELFELNGGALGLVPNKVLSRALADLPEPVRRVVEAEARLRRLLTQANTTYEELERVAVLAGLAPAETGAIVSRQRWSLHPSGFYVRYLPRSYSRTLIQVYVPDDAPLPQVNKSYEAHALYASSAASFVAAVPFNPAGSVAVPANTGAQRLGMSNRPVDGSTPQRTPPRDDRSSAGAMQKEVERGQAPGSIDRVDKGRGPFEKDHIHFKSGEALNYDGTWKHGSKTLSNREKNWIHDKHGWGLP